MLSLLDVYKKRWTDGWIDMRTAPSPQGAESALSAAEMCAACGAVWETALRLSMDRLSLKGSAFDLTPLREVHSRRDLPSRTSR